MIAVRWRFLGLCLIFTRIHPTASTITLSKIQPVTGFSDECTNAYNTPLSPCTALDFENGKPCSQSCIIFLDTLTAAIQKACQGTKVPPDTLMGMFFTFRGTKAICPNAQGSTSSDAANGIDVQPTITLPPNVKSAQDGSAENPKTITPEPTAFSSPAVPVNSMVSTTRVLQDAASATFITSVAPVDSATAHATSVTTIPLSALTAGMPETTDTAENLKATAGDGGGTPFDITSSSHHHLRPMTLGASVIVGFAMLTCLI